MNFLLEQLIDAAFRPQFERILNLLSIHGVTDVLANSAWEWWVDRGKGLDLVPEMAMPEERFNELARFLVALGGRHLDQITPITDVSVSVAALPVLQQLGIARLRVHAVLASEISDQTKISIRVHRAQVLTLDDLVKNGMVAAAQLAAIDGILNHRENFLVSGAAGTGKTTLLRAMLAATPQLRTVTVEDTFELMPVAGHVVGLQCRQPNTEGAGGIELAELARQALRMRPDRIVVGEVRGSEVDVLLRAMNTGHLGSAATIHANSADQVWNRLKTLALGIGYTDEGFELATAAALHWVIHVEVVGGVRRITTIRKFER